MENFEEHLMQKFPDLFPKDKDGKTTYSICGIGGHDDWQPIIEDMCAYLDSYCKNTYRFQKTKKIWPRIKHFFHQKITRKIYNRLYSLLDPYRGIIPAEFKKKKSYTIKPEWSAWAESRRRFKWQKSLSKFYFTLEPRDYFEKVHPPQAILLQIKEKMRSSRIYLDGDSHCQNTASFAEYLCDQITNNKLKIEKP